MQAGSPPGVPSFFPSASLVASFAASSSPDSEAPSIEGNSSSTADCCLWPNRVHSQPGCECCSGTTGLSTPSGPSEDRNRCCVIWAHTLIASPSRTPGWSPSPATTSSFAGEIPRMATRNGSCPWMSISFCAAFCYTCCRRVSSAYATSASSPTETALRSFPCAVACSATQRKRQLRQLNLLRKRFTHSGIAHSAVQPCTLSNGSPPHNSCFAHHLNQNGARHEALS